MDFSLQGRRKLSYGERALGKSAGHHVLATTKNFVVALEKTP